MRAEGFPGAESAPAQPERPALSRCLSAAGLRIPQCVPRQGVLLSLGVRVYVGRNPTWMGLCAHCVHACVHARLCLGLNACVHGRRVTGDQTLAAGV